MDSTARLQETTAAAACYRALEESLTNVVSAFKTPYAIILSGGVDTAALLASLRRCPSIPAPTVLVTISVDEGVAGEQPSSCEARDAIFAREIARLLAPTVPHFVESVTKQELIDASRSCVEILRSYDGMQIRNAVVPFIAMKRVLSQFPDTKAFVTGDGADELLGGYSFFWNYESERFEAERSQMCANWFFSTPVLADAIGCVALSPYTHPLFASWALQQPKSACVGEAPIIVHLGDEPQLHVTGKLCLRRAIDTPSAWRRKEPIQMGSRSEIMEHSEFWANTCWASEQDYLRSCFAAHFPLPCNEGTVAWPCSTCGYGLSDSSQKYCRTCGAWPARTA
ncbi:putative asparagine synthetase, glutamine-hydrolyzing [Porphyridium purpureum]|uniref:Putative asparagine synthetase, glutamine-hydrolyzing n=1 Tax=Porphyridium purpureum TaxID=35688 RepID=A0A5J4Z6M2_PORPP|nr:putative asparagine synthetase, glutamine-hydrolyzing [Porphyridium purpureum]|eukprot:POR4862..scf295_1